MPVYSHAHVFLGESKFDEYNKRKNLIDSSSSYKYPYGFVFTIFHTHQYIIELLLA